MSSQFNLVCVLYLHILLPHWYANFVIIYKQKNVGCLTLSMDVNIFLCCHFPTFIE